MTRVRIAVLDQRVLIFGSSKQHSRRLPIFTFVTLGFRTGINIGLDVTRWLRLLPADKNRRARIAARYVSLLRRLARPLESGRPEGATMRLSSWLTAKAR